LEAELVDFAECVAIATERNVKWVGGRISHLFRESRFSRRSSSSKGYSRSSRRTSKSKATGSVYIIHDLEGEAHASVLQEGILTHTQTKQCYMGTTTCDDDMEVSLERVASSGYVILLQTETVLMHPWPLLATYHAALAGVPITCVVVAESGYDFKSVELHFKHLDERLDAASLEQMSDVLSRWMPPRTVAGLQSKLYGLVPQIISVVYDSSGTSNQFVATIRDIHDKQSMMQENHRRRSGTFDDEERMRRRSSDAMEQLAMEAEKAANREKSKLHKKSRLRLSIGAVHGASPTRLSRAASSRENAHNTPEDSGPIVV
jgi:hypothetical protein